MKGKKYLPMYKAWIQTGRIPKRGLCPSVGGGIVKRLFKPAWASNYSFWLSNDEDCCPEFIAHNFNTLRQNVVLLLAALNNEL